MYDQKRSCLCEVFYIQNSTLKNKLTSETLWDIIDLYSFEFHFYLNYNTAYVIDFSFNPTALI